MKCFFFFIAILLRDFKDILRTFYDVNEAQLSLWTNQRSVGGMKGRDIIFRHRSSHEDERTEQDSTGQEVPELQRSEGLWQKTMICALLCQLKRA